MQAFFNLIIPIIQGDFIWNDPNAIIFLPIMATTTYKYFRSYENYCNHFFFKQLKLLRQEVEARMTKCLKRGQTISSDVSVLF